MSDAWSVLTFPVASLREPTVEYYDDVTADDNETNLDDILIGVCFMCSVVCFLFCVFFCVFDIHNSLYSGY